MKPRSASKSGAKAAKPRTARSASSAATNGPVKRRSAKAGSTKSAAPDAKQSPATNDVDAVIARLRSKSTRRDLENLARFGIETPKPLGVSMANLKPIAKRIGRDHELAAALWASGWYEARMLATLVDDPARVTPAQMERWARDFDNWAICDTACFALFDRTPHAWTMIERWHDRRPEFEKRAAFALLASVALHDKACGDAPFLAVLPTIEKSAADGRNFVKKGISWALRAVGRRNARLLAPSIALAERLARSVDPAARWIGKDALRDFEKAAERRAARSQG